MVCFDSVYVGQHAVSTYVPEGSKQGFLNGSKSSKLGFFVHVKVVKYISDYITLPLNESQWTKFFTVQDVGINLFVLDNLGSYGVLGPGKGVFKRICCPIEFV